MASEYALRIPLERHVINTERPFAAVVEEIREHLGRSEPGDGHGLVLMSDGLRVRRANGTPVPARLVGLGELDVGLGPAGRPEAGRMLRLLVDMPAATGELVRFLPDAGVSCPATILVRETGDGGARLVYDSVASSVSIYQEEESLSVARRLDTEVLALLRHVADRE
ncbi:hypothetical protein GCM10023196_060990 [Actinoallomurus vinaceus]|uniref:DUF302 domain-containing protein n=1 Tax=Actinoallomurus vinaceus TaxID=1080074 RepID=A0ABP8UHH0_9ACTN